MTIVQERIRANQHLIGCVANALAHNQYPALLDKQGKHEEAAALRFALGVVEDLHLSEVVERQVTQIQNSKHDQPIRNADPPPDHEYEQGRNVYEWGCGCKLEINPHSQVLHSCSGNDCQREPERESITLYEYPDSD